MAEDQDLMPFDPTMKKKKKKKKTGFDLDAAMGEDSGAADGQPSAPPPVEEEEVDKPDQEVEASQDKAADDISLDFTNMKKKKKKKKAFDLEEVGDALPETTETSEVADPSSAAVDGDLEDLDFTKKKKKKKKVVTLDGGADENLPEPLDEDGQNGDEGSGGKWGDTDRDYTYEELLTRVFDIMREKNPDIMAGEKKKFVMRPPQVLRVGTRKTSFANFADICRLLHRQPKHVLAFLLAELGTSGSVDGNNQLIIRGRYTQKQIENVLRRYIKEYVTCHTCRSRDTLLQKDTRLFFLQCETCGSRCSVASIKTGFQAVTGKRAALRAKTA